ncbi:hypothetical protein GCM10022252_13260 [Streptosporangium oxazolinicum]|uniref:ABC transporter permease n=1 Tax=Streptosporangium oxazolinicum TaxID=909287 RepID=A0ABP8AI73_9ACTN
MILTGRRRIPSFLVVARNLFLVAGTFMVLGGVGITLFDAPSLYWNTRGVSTPASFVLVALSKPVVLVLGGLGMMLGSIAAALGCPRTTVSGGGE